MRHLKMRLLGPALIVIFAGMIYYNWGQLHSGGRYSLKMAAFGPLGVVGGLFVLLFPSKGGKPETVADKIIALLVFAAGAAAGLVNWYLMDPASSADERGARAGSASRGCGVVAGETECSTVYPCRTRGPPRC